MQHREASVVETLRTNGAAQRRVGGETVERGRRRAGHHRVVQGVRRRDRARGAHRRRHQRRRVRIVPGNLRYFLVLVAQAVEDAVSAAQHPPAANLVCETDTRSDVVVISVDDRPRVAVLAGDGETDPVEVKKAAAVARVHRLRIEVVTQAEIQRQARRDFPVVLEKRAEVNFPLASPVEHLGALDQARKAHQVIGKRSPGARRVAAGGKDRAEDELAEERIAAEVVEPWAADVGAGLQRVPAAGDRDRVRELEAVFVAQVAGAAAPAIELRRAGRLAGEIERDAWKALHREGEERELVLERELHALVDVVHHAAPVVAREAGAELVHHHRREHVRIAEDHLADVAVLGVAAADKAVERPGLRRGLIAERETAEDVVL